MEAERAREKVREWDRQGKRVRQKHEERKGKGRE